MTSPSLVKKAYDGVALFAIVNLLALVGLAAYAMTSGILSKDKAVQIATVLSGGGSEKEGESSEELLVAQGESGETSSTAQSTGSSRDDLSILRYESDRLKAELDQQLALVHGMMLRVTTARESFASQRKAEMQRRESQNKTREEGGFKKQVEIYQALRPKVAMEHMLSLGSLDDAAAILMQMTTRKAKSIIESAKRRDQMDKMKEILKRVSESAPERSDLLEGATP